MIQLRDYQETSIDEIRTALAKYRRVLFQLSTGGGKSLIFSTIAILAQKKGRRVLILSPRTEILSQNGGSIERLGGNVDYISPRHRNIPEGNLVCAMAQTLQRRVLKEEWLEWLQSVNIVVVDEAHLQTADFIYDLLPERCFVLLVTATPRRSGHQRQLGSIAKAMVTGVTTKELISRGYLCPARHFSLVAPKLDDVKIDYGKGDYNGSQLAKAFESRKHYTGTVDEWERLARERKTIFFCCSSEQTIETTKELVSRGYKAKYVLSGTFDDDDVYSGSRSAVFDEFKRGEIQVLVNLGIAVAGLDVPDITCVVLDFATISLPKYLQALGRGSRPSPGKSDFMVLDAGENYRKHGAYDADRVWSLWHSESLGTGEPVLKECPPDKKDRNGRRGCGEWMPQTVKVCKCCGFVFPTDEDVYRLRLEEVVENTESDSPANFAARKKREGWSTPRIMIQICLANADNPKPAFTEACNAIGVNPKYWYFFSREIWSKIKRKKEQKSENLWQ